jgi:cyclophilin family peptidyl-prolyl cis-trans isomerase
MIQGGCPNTKEGEKGMPGTGGPGYMIKAEFNAKSHVRGVLSMARSSSPDSAGSQFFICHGDARFLDRQYTAFGELVSGEEVLEKIANVPTSGLREEHAGRAGRAGERQDRPGAVLGEAQGLGDRVVGDPAVAGVHAPRQALVLGKGGLDALLHDQGHVGLGRLGEALRGGAPDEGRHVGHGVVDDAVLL